MQIPEQQVHESSPGKFTTEASDIGLANWHTDLRFRGLVLRLVTMKRDPEGDLQYAVYDSNDGSISLTVYND